jgi:hypothetical protein
MLSALVFIQQSLSLTIPIPADRPPTFAQISDPNFVVKYREVGEASRALQAFYAGCLSRTEIASVDDLEVCFNRTRTALRDGVISSSDIRPSSYDLEWTLLPPTVEFVRNHLNREEVK